MRRPAVGRRSAGATAERRVGTASIYYASDIHGSDCLWRKFLGAGKFYGVQALIMGGDLAGKAIVPLVERNGVYEARFLGECRMASNASELEDLVEAIRLNGMYVWIAGEEEVAAHSTDPDRHAELFEQVIGRDLRQWVKLADERLAGSDTDAYIIAGNDDPWFVDDILRGSEALFFCDEQLVRIGDHEMISSSYANPTPWDSPRELDEEELYRRLRGLAEQLERPERAIFNLHVPPYDSGLDRATKIDDEFRVVVEGGSTTEIPVGSHAVRQLIEEFQPLLALHGHIHESRGAARIGRTLALNSGSEYNTGRIHGVVVRLDDDSVSSYQFVVG